MMPQTQTNPQDTSDPRNWEKYKNKPSGSGAPAGPDYTAIEEQKWREEFEKGWEGGKASGIAGARWRATPEYKTAWELFKKKKVEAKSPPKPLEPKPTPSPSPTPTPSSQSPLMPMVTDMMMRGNRMY